jgi:hypothetical protein
LAIGLGLAARTSPAQAQFADPGVDGRCERDRERHHCVCFLPGTMIETKAGPRAVEDLMLGDGIVTAFGEIKPLKWVAKQQVRRSPFTAPVKIARFAIDGKSPHTDLYVSPAHAIFVDGVLIPAGDLANGITIVAGARPELQSIDYYHVELDGHDVILAEGLAVESYLGGDRSSFDNVGEYVALYGSLGEPYTPAAPMLAYSGGRQQLASHIRSAVAPICDFRRPIDTVRDRLAVRAGAPFAA